LLHLQSFRIHQLTVYLRSQQLLPNTSSYLISLRQKKLPNMHAVQNFALLALATVAAAQVTQIADGQPQAPTNVATPPAVTQISDGQIQAPSSAAVYPSAPAVTQISDGQIQAPSSVAPVPSSVPAVTQISDGQIQAPTTEAVPPPQAPTASYPTHSNGTQPTVVSPTVAPPVETGAAALFSWSVEVAGLAGIAAVVAML
jgi:hypothetical protein